jgi:uncharacterized integral membrane protein
MNDFITWTLFLVAFVLVFGVFEARALRHPENSDRVTLSRYIWTLGQKWPLTLVLWGLIVGGLSVHFFWNWCPALGSTNGLGF